MQETNYIKIQIIKGLNARRLYKSFGVKGLNFSQYSSKLTVCNSLNISTADSLNEHYPDVVCTLKWSLQQDESGGVSIPVCR
jgi:hypothetical protein